MLELLTNAYTAIKGLLARAPSQQTKLMIFGLLLVGLILSSDIEAADKTDILMFITFPIIAFVYWSGRD